ncbi:MAG: TetR/AcrR family transcriptional regulator [Pseudomonadota bacterium]
MPAVGKHRAPIIDAAIMHFRQQGYPGTGLNDIVKTSGAPKGSLYHYFPDGKPSIAVAAVEEAARRMAVTMKEIVDESDSAGDFLKGFGKTLGDWLKASGYRDGCPMTTVLLELCPEDRDISKAGRTAYNLRIDGIREALERDGISPSQSEDLAIVWLSALNGALIHARVLKSTRPIETVARLLTKALPAQIAPKEHGG